jgi:hypothetical protein
MGSSIKLTKKMKKKISLIIKSDLLVNMIRIMRTAGYFSRMADVIVIGGGHAGC